MKEKKGLKGVPSWTAPKIDFSERQVQRNRDETEAKKNRFAAFTQKEKRRRKKGKDKGKKEIMKNAKDL